MAESKNALESLAEYKLEKYARKFDNKRQTVADALIDLGAEATIEALAERTGYDKIQVEATLALPGFMRFFKMRCINRGYTVDAAEERHRYDYHRIDLLRSKKLHDPKSNNLSLKDLCAIERSIAQADLMRRQNEHLKTMSRSDEKARMMNHNEILDRLKSTEAGKRFLFKKGLADGAAPQQVENPASVDGEAS